MKCPYRASCRDAYQTLRHHGKGIRNEKQKGGRTVFLVQDPLVASRSCADDLGRTLAGLKLKKVTIDYPTQTLAVLMVD